MWCRVCLASLLLFLAVILASQGVLTYFHDTAENANNTFATGTWATDNLHPGTGSKDETAPESINLNTTELAYVETSDDTWYEVKHAWPAVYDTNKRLDFGFPDIPADVTVLGVAVTVEWAWLSNLTNPGAHAKLRLLRDATTWQEYNLTVPSTNSTDIIETVDVSDYVQTFEHVNYLQVRFYAEFTAAPPETIKTRHDLVEVWVNYQ